jgi:hypothetical protein
MFNPSDFDIVNQISTSFLILISSFLYARFGTTKLAVFNESSNNTHESNKIVKDLMKYTMFDCFTTNPNIGKRVIIFAIAAFP